MTSIVRRLTFLNFLQFAVWGAYLICLGQYLGASGLGAYIPWFYSAQGFVCLFMPAIMGMVADKYIPAQKLLGSCHLVSSSFMLLAWWYGMNHPVLEFAPFFTLYIISVAFYMPTIALSNSVAFSLLKSHGKKPVEAFPPIRMFGTIGFVISMWFVNSAYYSDGVFGFTLSEANPYSGMRLQYTCMQLFVSGVLGLFLGAYSFIVGKVAVPNRGGSAPSLASIFKLDAFRLFADKRMALFFIFSMLMGVALQITNGYATSFITSFKGMAEFSDSFGANNATLLTSLSQMSEAGCLLLIPFFLRRFGIKWIIFIAMVAWVLRFACFSLGNPGSGLWLFILSMLVYGVAFDFFNVSGALFLEQETDNSIKASAQGLFMLVTNGLGASIGMIFAGKVVNHYCTWQNGYLVGQWDVAWGIFAGYAAVVALLFVLFFRYKHVRAKEEAVVRAEGESLEIE